MDSPSPQSVGGEEVPPLLAPLFQVQGSREAVFERNLANVIDVTEAFIASTFIGILE